MAVIRFRDTNARVIEGDKYNARNVLVIGHAIKNLRCSILLSV